MVQIILEVSLLSFQLILDDWFNSGSYKPSYPHHIDMVQTTAFHESGENGSFENINIEREAINYGEEIIGSRFAEENSNYYGYL